MPRARTSHVGLRGLGVEDTGDGVRCNDFILSGVASRRDPGVAGRRSVRMIQLGVLANARRSHAGNAESSRLIQVQDRLQADGSITVTTTENVDKVLSVTK
jgi:hypothetical protein